MREYIMEKEFIPFEEAKVLKDLGFNKPCFRYYWKTQKNLMGKHGNYQNNTSLISQSKTHLMGLLNTEFCSAPLWQQAFEFLKEKYGIVPEYYPRSWSKEEPIKWTMAATILPKWLTHIQITDRHNDDPYDTYEEARLECLKGMIKLIQERPDLFE